MNRISNKHFNELKRAAIEIWNTYDDTYGYRSEKLAQINNIKNIKDNYTTIITMFDNNNLALLAQKLKKETREELADKISGNGLPDIYNPFIPREEARNGGEYYE